MAVAADTTETGAKFGLALGADLEFGGDEVATVAFDDGSTQDVKAGQGITVAVGGYYKPNVDSPFSLAATVGYKFITTQASNADIGIDRLVFEVLGRYEFANGFWVGAGPVRHT